MTLGIELMNPYEEISTINDYNTGIYPVMISPDLDGARCYTGIREALSRSGKKFLNPYVQEVLKFLPPGLDGELTVEGYSTSPLNRRSGEPIKFTFNVYDCFAPEVYPYPWNDRIEYARFSVETFWSSKPEFKHHVSLVEHRVAYNFHELRSAYEDVKTKSGAVIRLTEYPYEFGKKSKSLIKVKPLTQSQALILGVKDKASSITCRWKNGEEFSIRSGFEKGMREWIWKNKEEIIGWTAVFSYLESRTKTKPYRPTFEGVIPNETNHA